MPQVIGRANTIIEFQLGTFPVPKKHNPIVTSIKMGNNIFPNNCIITIKSPYFALFSIFLKQVSALFTASWLISFCVTILKLSPL